MKSRRTSHFRELFERIPEATQRQAEAAYRTFEQNPHHPGLHFKQVSNKQSVHSVRIGRSYRALGLLQGDTVYWFWIGTHADYDQMLAKMR